MGDTRNYDVVRKTLEEYTESLNHTLGSFNECPN